VRALPLLVLVAALAGCSSSEPTKPAPQIAPAGPDLDAELARAREKKCLAVVFVTESQSPIPARFLLEDPEVRARMEKHVLVDLDVNVSRSRAAAMRFHLRDTPTPFVVYLSSQGLELARDVKEITKAGVLRHIEEAEREGPKEDAVLAELEAVSAQDPGDSGAHTAIAAVQVDLHDMQGAIPHLEKVARSERADLPLRVRSWVNLARAHYWIGENEKGLHEARDLMATLGPRSPEALAAGHLVIGIAHAAAGRREKALEELDAAIAAAPDSDYGRKAQEERSKLVVTTPAERAPPR